MNNLALYAACVFTVVFGVTDHPFMALVIGILGVALCLAIISRRDHP